MKFPAQIQQHETIAPKKENDTPLHRLTILDKSTIGAERSSTAFVMFIGEQTRKKLPQGDLTDAHVTVLAREFKAGSQGIQIRGELAVAKAKN